LNTEHGFTLGELARLLDIQLSGDAEIKIHGLASLESAGKGDLGFLSNPKLQSRLSDCGASAVILHPDLASTSPLPCLLSLDPYVSYARASQLFARRRAERESVAVIHSTAVISDEATLADGVSIGPGAVIEAGVHIGRGAVIGANVYIGFNSSVGEDSHLNPGVVVYHDVRIGARVILHSGAVIGADGFGFAKDGRQWVKIAQLGGVCIGDDVEIGAGSTVDRGALDDTIIEEGVKIDNLVQIAHNCVVGAHSLLCGCSAMAGSARLGKYCTVGGGVGIIGHVSIADGTVISAMSFVNRGIDKPGLYSSGSVLQSGREWKKNAIRQLQLDDMARRLRELERKLGE